MPSMTPAAWKVAQEPSPHVPASYPTPTYRMCFLDSVEDHFGILLLAGVIVLIGMIHPAEALVACIDLFECCLRNIVIVSDHCET